MWPLLKQPKHRPFCRRMLFFVSGSVTTAHLFDGWGPLQKVHHISLFGSGPSWFENNVDEMGGPLIWPWRNSNPKSRFSFTPKFGVCSETGPRIHLSRIYNFSAKDFIIVSKSHLSGIPRLKIRRNSRGILAIMTGVRNVQYVSDDTLIPCKLSDGRFSFVQKLP